MNINWTMILDAVPWMFSGVGIFMAVEFYRYAKSVPRLPFSRADKELKPQFRGKRDLLALIQGRWVGRAVEVDPDAKDAFDAVVDWNFEVVGEEVRCHSCAIYPINGSESKDCFTLVGRVLYDRFIVLEYWDDDERNLGFGTEIIQISDDGSSFSGRYVGYSSDRGRIATGILEGKRR